MFTIKSQGGDVRVVYSPLDCLKIARANPDKKVVFFAIGFETTAPANAMLVWRAQEEGVKNVSILVSHVLVPPAIAAILQSPLTACRDSWGRDTYARSWDTANTSRSPRDSRCPLS